MKSEWQELTWGDIATIEYGKGLRNYQNSTGLYRVYGTNGPIGWYEEPLCNHPGVIIGRKGAYRGIHYSPRPFYVIDTAFYLNPKIDFDMKWAYYELLTHDINSMDSGSAIPSTSRDSFYLLSVKVPPLNEQRAIAHILGTLDDKIELNRQMNETLEAIARAIFKSWFVDFDPVRAKAEGRDPALPPDIAALFPDSFEDSELGPIPKGWKFGTIGDIGENPRRVIKPTELTKDMPYIGLEHMPRRCIALSEWGSAENITSNKSYFYKSEILFGKLRPYFHKVGVPPVDGVCSTDILVIAPKSQIWFGFLLGHLSNDDLVSYASAASTGTKMPRTSWKDIARYKVVVPPVPIASTFDLYARPYVNYIHANIHHSHTLAAVRDALLPKLLSGELRVPDAEKFVEEMIEHD